jgi:glycosyltransferase 2 family protein
MKKTLLTILQYVIFLGLGIVIIIYMSDQLTAKDKEEMGEAIRSVRLWLLIPIFFAGFLSHFFRALRWKLLLEPLEIRPSTINTTFSVLIGYLVNLALPRAGEVAKCTVLAKYEKVPADKMVGTILAERAFDVLCLVIITALAFMLQAHVIGNYAHNLFVKIMHKRKLFLTLLLILIAVVLVAIFFYRRNRASKVGVFIKGMSHGIRAIIHMQKRWRFIGYTCLMWMMYLLQVYIGFLCLPATEHLSVLASLVVLIFGSIGMITTQGGIGAYTLLVANILLFYGIDDGNAHAFGWVAWLVQTGSLCILGLLSLLLLPIYNRNRNAQITVDRA